MVNDIPSYHHNRYEHPPLHNHNSNDSHHAHLRLALGSILSPKRPHSAQSSLSGTASPAPFTHYTGRASHSPPDHSVHPPPTMTSRTQSSSSPDSSSHPPSPHDSPRPQPISHIHAEGIVQEVQPPVPMSGDGGPPTRPPLAVVFTNDGAHQVESQVPPSGQRTPSGRFIATLQSKSAWDALIHGSMV